MCPSPACGGFWASPVNNASATTYVASVGLGRLAAGSAARAQAALRSPGTLVAGDFVPYASDDFPQLLSLSATRVWLPALAGRTEAAVYRVLDTGIRCIRAPCFSYRAMLVNRGKPAVRLSEVDLAAAGAPATAVARARALLGRGGVLVAGEIKRVVIPNAPDAGRTLVVDQLWLPA
jgi:hypothetical protein